MTATRSKLSLHKPVVFTLLTATWLAAGLVFIGGSTVAVNRALGIAVTIYEADMGRYPIRGSRYTTPNDNTGRTTFPGSVFDTEIVSMSLTGRLEPPNGSVELPADGNFIVDSFFDVHTELSVDGGHFNVDSFFDISYRITNTGNGKVPADGSHATGSWETEMISMSLSGQHPTLGQIVIQESPTLASLGEHSITPIDKRLFNVDSFFDVFTEISIDGGPFVPSAGSVRMNLSSIVPEPASAVLALLGLIGLAIATRRRRRG